MIRGQLQKSVLSFNHVVSMGQTQVIMLAVTEPRQHPAIVYLFILLLVFATIEDQLCHVG